MKSKWPEEKYSTATANGNRYASDYDQGWNHCLDACESYRKELEEENKRLREALKGIMRSTPHSMCSDAVAWAMAEQALGEGKP